MISSLEEELSNATEAGLELNQMLSDFLTSQNQNDSLQGSIEALQEQLNSQHENMSALHTDLALHINEVSNVIYCMHSDASLQSIMVWLQVSLLMLKLYQRYNAIVLLIPSDVIFFTWFFFKSFFLLKLLLLLFIYILFLILHVSFF